MLSIERGMASRKQVVLVLGGCGRKHGAPDVMLTACLVGVCGPRWSAVCAVHEPRVCGGRPAYHAGWRTFG